MVQPELMSFVSAYARQEYPSVRLELLGGMRVTAAGQEVFLPNSSQRVLALLAVQNRPITRIYASGCLWPEVSENRASGNLRSAIWRIRKKVEHLVQATPTTISLDPRVATDVSDLVDSARRLLKDHNPLPIPRGQALDFFAQELLPDCYEDWILLERERLRQISLAVLENTAKRLAAEGDYAEAINAAFKAIALDSLRESAHKTLIQVYVRSGNHGEAVRQFARIKKAIQEEFGTPLPADLQHLGESLGVS